MTVLEVQRQTEDGVSHLTTAITYDTKLMCSSSDCVEVQIVTNSVFQKTRCLSSPRCAAP